MKLKKTHMIIGAALAAMSWTASASAGGKDDNFDWVFHANLEGGGDEMVKVYFADGSKDSIKAGELLQVSFGFVVDTLPSVSPNLETQFTVGWKFTDTTAKNGDVSWDRYPIEVLEFYDNNRWRIGAGITYHSSPVLKGTGVASNIGTTKFEDSTGTVVELDFYIGDNAYLGARATSIDYKVLNGTGQAINGNSAGVVLGARF